MSKAKKNLRNGTSKPASSSKESKIRIIGGEWRGRKLPVLDAEGLRPTGDRLRETLFNWLMPHIHGAQCLDAFSGTGALAFEALSRGASDATLIEKNTDNAQQLRENVNALQAKAEIINQDFLTWIPPKHFDLVFLDPPFRENLWQSAIDHLINHQCLKENTLIYIEQPFSKIVNVPEHWQQIKCKKTGQLQATLFEVGA